MTLYKYLHPDRIDVLHNLQIRFTQPNYLNDPYESNPVVTGSDCSDEDWAKITDIECKRSGLNPADFKNLKDKRVRDRMFPDMWQLMKAAFHHTSGILSLTEDPLNVLMWSHYAYNHGGFVIGFKVEHAFFPRSDKPYIANSLHPVEYAEKRPLTILEKLSLKDLFFTKSAHWSYEKEWRVFKNLSTADQVLADGQIALYSFPPDLIECVILGAATPTEIEEKIAQQARAVNEKLPIYKTRLHQGTYDLEMISLDEWLTLTKEFERTSDMLERFRKDFYAKLLG